MPQIQRQVIKPQLDVPFIVRLDKGCEGQQRQNDNGIYFQYVVNGNQDIMWLPHDGHDALLRTGAKPGAEVEIVKTMHDKTVNWSAKLLHDGSESATPTRTKKRLPSRVYYQPEPDRNSKPPGPVSIETRTPAISPTSKHLMGCLCAAIDAAVEAQEYGRNHGLGLTFLGSDIRAMADTIYINDQKRSAS